MRLQDFLNTAEKFSFEAIAKDKDLSSQIQIVLIGLYLLEPLAT